MALLHTFILAFRKQRKENVWVWEYPERVPGNHGYREKTCFKHKKVETKEIGTCNDKGRRDGGEICNKLPSREYNENILYNCLKGSSNREK